MSTTRDAVYTDPTPDAGRRIEIQIPHQRPASVFVHASAEAFVDEAYALGFEFDPDSDQTELEAAEAWAFHDLAFGALLTEADAAADLALGRSAIWWTNYLAAAPKIDARLRDALGVDDTGAPRATCAECDYTPEDATERLHVLASPDARRLCHYCFAEHLRAAPNATDAAEMLDHAQRAATRERRNPHADAEVALATIAFLEPRS